MPKTVVFRLPSIYAQANNYSRKPAAFLPTIRVEGINNPVVQIVNNSSEEIVYTLRIQGNTFRPPVFREGRYTVHIGDPDLDVMKSFPDVQASSMEVNGEIYASFNITE